MSSRKLVKIRWQYKIVVTVAAVITSIGLLSAFSTAKAQPDDSASEVTVSAAMEGEEGYYPLYFWYISGAFTGRGTGVASGAQSNFIGTSPEVPEIPVNSSTGVTGTLSLNPKLYQTGGAVGFLANVGSQMYDYSPVSTPAYVRTVASKIGVAGETYAATTSSGITGFDALSPVSVIWGMFRNIAYVLFTIILVIWGFIVMVSKKQGQSNNVDVFTGIVSIGVGLLAVTFSFAIGALIFDLTTNVANGLVASIMGPYVNSEKLLILLGAPNTNTNIITLMGDLQAFGVTESARKLITQLLAGIGIPMAQVTRWVGSFGQASGDPIAAGAGSIFGWLVGIVSKLIMGLIVNSTGNSALITAIVSFLIFIATVRVVFTLIGAYFGFILEVMMSPLILLPMAFPGNTKMLGNWIASLASKGLAFPTVFLVLLLSAVAFNLNSSYDISKYSECYVESVSVNNTSVSERILGTDKQAWYFDTARPTESTDAEGNTVPIADDANHTYCYPVLLPPRFNVWPVPMGYLQGVDPDQLFRFVLGVGLIVTAPTAGAMWQSLLKVQEMPILQQVMGGVRQGVGAFGSYVGAMPLPGIGKLVQNLVGNIPMGK